MRERDNRPISQRFAEAGRRWVQLNAAAELLEESKSAVLAQLVTRQGDLAVNRAEANVKASPEWTEYLSKMVKAREEAGIAKIECEYLRMAFSEWQSEQANERLQAKL